MKPLIAILLLTAVAAPGMARAEMPKLPYLSELDQAKYEDATDALGERDSRRATMMGWTAGFSILCHDTTLLRPMAVKLDVQDGEMSRGLKAVIAKIAGLSARLTIDDGGCDYYRTSIRPDMAAAVGVK